MIVSLPGGFHPPYRLGGILAVGDIAMKSRVAFDPEFDAPAKGREEGEPKPRRLVKTLITLGIISPIVGCMLSPILTSPNFGKPRGSRDSRPATR